MVWSIDSDSVCFAIHTIVFENYSNVAGPWRRHLTHISAILLKLERLRFFGTNEAASRGFGLR